MSSSNARNIVELRQLLAARFPGVRMSAERPEGISNHFPTGLPRLDSLLDGGLPRGAITEIVSPGIASGTSLLIASLLERARESGEWIALIDSADSFDPTPFPNETLSRLLWVRCNDPRQAVKATDLLLHDGTLSIVVLDLIFSRPNQIRKTPSSTWFRLQRILENTSTAFVVLAPEHMISNAVARCTLEKRFSLESLDHRRETLLAQVAPTPLETGKQRIVKMA
jgi:hypothetical protein